MCPAKSGRSYGFMSRANVGLIVTSGKEISELMNMLENNCKSVITFFKMYSVGFCQFITLKRCLQTQ